MNRFALLLVTALLGLGARTAPAAGDPTRGKVLFQQMCALCHATGQDGLGSAGQGPTLAGIVGRRAASLSDFGYTTALAEAHLVWDPATLAQFLEAPTALVPGATMVLTVPAAADRADLVAFLATLRPAAMPAEEKQAAAAAHAPGTDGWQNDAPGVVHRIDPASLPQPFATGSVGNHPQVVARPEGARLSVPAGFEVKLIASGLVTPRVMRTAPNGDIFISETSENRIRVIRLAPDSGSVIENRIFTRVEGRVPFGIAFHPTDGEPRWIYIAQTNSVTRFPYRNGDLAARGPAEVVLPRLTESRGGHGTRNIAFSPDGQQMFVSVGSGSNVAETMTKKTAEEIRAWEAAHGPGAAWDNETGRACILACNPNGENLRVFATGLRNAVGIAVQPATGVLWASVNERDGLGDDLVPDYVTRVREGGFYGWPWYYIGDHEEPRLAGARPDLAGQAIVPDVLLQAHSASLQLVFYPANATGPAAFPAGYRGDIFVALHGSWNRAGGKIIRAPLRDGLPGGEYEDFLTGFVIDDRHVWGRPAGIDVTRDGSLLMTDDANGTLWRITGPGK